MQRTIKKVATAAIYGLMDTAELAARCVTWKLAAGARPRRQTRRV